MTLLASFAPLFAAPSFRTFCGLACGFLARPGSGRCAACCPGRGDNWVVLAVIVQRIQQVAASATGATGRPGRRPPARFRARIEPAR